MADGMTVYNRTIIERTYTDLRQYHGDLAKAGGDDLTAASKTLELAWTDQVDGSVNRAYTEGYGPVKSSWDSEFENTLATINNIAAALENALIAAFGADAAVADGFGAL
jgi:hypothetical protein